MGEPYFIFAKYARLDVRRRRHFTSPGGKWHFEQLDSGFGSLFTLYVERDNHGDGNFEWITHSAAPLPLSLHPPPGFDPRSLSRNNFVSLSEIKSDEMIYTGRKGSGGPGGWQGWKIILSENVRVSNQRLHTRSLLFVFENMGWAVSGVEILPSCEKENYNYGAIIIIKFNGVKRKHGFRHVKRCFDPQKHK